MRRRASATRVERTQAPRAGVMTAAISSIVSTASRVLDKLAGALRQYQAIAQPAFGHVEHLGHALALARGQLALVALLDRLRRRLPAEELRRARAARRPERPSARRAAPSPTRAARVPRSSTSCAVHDRRGPSASRARRARICGVAGERRKSSARGTTPPRGGERRTRLGLASTPVRCTSSATARRRAGCARSARPGSATRSSGARRRSRARAGRCTTSAGGSSSVFRNAFAACVVEALGRVDDVDLARGLDRREVHVVDDVAHLLDHVRRRTLRLRASCTSGWSARAHALARGTRRRSRRRRRRARTRARAPPSSCRRPAGPTNR